MDEPRWLMRVLVEAIHHGQISEHGGLQGLRDEGALESALSRPRQKWTYESEPDVPGLAAAYAFAIARNHPFRDGNERTAFVAAVVFLRLNGLRFRAADEEVVGAMVSLAAGETSEEELAAWIRGRVEGASER